MKNFYNWLDHSDIQTGHPPAHCCHWDLALSWDLADGFPSSNSWMWHSRLQVLLQPQLLQKPPICHHSCHGRTLLCLNIPYVSDSQLGLQTCCWPLSDLVYPPLSGDFLQGLPSTLICEALPESHDLSSQRLHFLSSRKPHLFSGKAGIKQKISQLPWRRA